MTFKVGDKVRYASAPPSLESNLWCYDGRAKTVVKVEDVDWQHDNCSRWHNNLNNAWELVSNATPAQPQSITIDGQETFLATAEELAKDWEGKEIQYSGEWMRIEKADETQYRRDFFLTKGFIKSCTPEQLIPYRLAKPAKTLEDVIEEAVTATTYDSGQFDTYERHFAHTAAIGIREHFDVTPKEAK